MMVDSWRRLKERLRAELSIDPLWGRYMREIEGSSGTPRSVHLAVFREPYLQLIVDGRKTVESRFSAVRCAPYLRVRPGDIVLLKRSGGPVSGICTVGAVWSYELDPESWVEVKRFADALCATDPTFWSEREGAAYATLMQVRDVKELPSLAFNKRDRRGWVVLQDRAEIPDPP
jgi:hypothetical protein